MKRILILLSVIICNLVITNAQSLDGDVKSKKDSTLYRNIYEYSKQNRLNKFIYERIFRRPQNKPDISAKRSPAISAYKEFDQKIIRNIIITKEAPFEIDQKNASTTKNNLIKIGNLIHTNTQSFVIKNLLLFKENEIFDSLLIQESERLLRRQSYVEKSSISGMIIENNNDSVDILVVVKDKFSIYPEADMSSTKLGLGFKEINLFGIGHQAHIYYSWDFPGKINNYQYDYSIPNIMNTYVNTGILYKSNKVDGSETKQFFAARPFYSALTKWAGSINLMQQAQQYDIAVSSTGDAISRQIRYNMLDFWGAHAFNVKSNNTIKARTRKLILSTRYYHIDYPQAPEPEYDPNNAWSAENLYLLSLGISKRTYKKDAYLFRYGFTEDVPVGYAGSITTGIHHKNRKTRLYISSELSVGKYFKPGYFSGALEYGSFIDRTNIEEGVFTAEMSYFTPLLELDKWKFRQFVKIQYMTGINRLQTDYVYLQDYFGISGFNTQTVAGTQKIVCNLQTQVFSPWSLLGFRFAPYFIYSMGMLGNNDRGFAKSRVYSLFGLGFLIRNDFLVFNSFQISVSFYPYIPDKGRDIFKFNAYETSDFRFNDFDIRKPERIVYK